ncbi:MAG: DUF6675 family protein [Acetobacteraceae bacterium]|nr:DUF6675 family protein [Acetobacteraceae bacterium]
MPAGRNVDFKVWTAAQLKAGWRPPACSGWTMPGARSVITVSGRLALPGGASAVLARFGAISAYVGVRYWSVTDRQWKTLITAAHALDASGRARRDFSAEEMGPGRVLAYSQTDSGAGTTTYRMRVIAESENRIVLTTENAGTIRYLFVPLFSPGELQTLYVLDRQSEGMWAYTSLTRTLPGASSLTDGHTDSGVNRAVAMYRHIAGIASDQDPPAIR